MTSRKNPSVRRSALSLAVLLLLGACASSPPTEPASLLSPSEQQAKLRNLQSRDLDVADREQTMLAVIATLQSLDFIIERANAPLGVVTAARFKTSNGYDVVGVTVTVREVSESQTSVRMNAIFNNSPVRDPEVYQNFFATLQRELFLDRN